MAQEAPLFARVAQAFSRLTEREKRLVLITGGVAVVFVLVLGTTLVSSALDKREKRVAMRRDEIAQLEGLRDKYQEAVQAEDRSKRRITSNTTSLFSLLQKNASEVGLSLTDLNERRAPVKDAPDLTEVTVELNLKEISVDKLDNLLEKIEGKRTDGVVKVTKMKVKTRFDNAEMLETSMTVSTWKSSGAATAPAPTENP
jgi:type II secretory pathway component PulM